MRTEENVFRFLDRIRANGKEIPSLRAIRSEVGGGSLSTISKAVNDWKVANQPILTPCRSRSVKNN